MSVFFGKREFWSESRIVKLALPHDGDDHWESLLIFSTKKQRTWLVAHADGLVCVLDDLRRERPRVQWREPPDYLVSGGEVTVEIKARPKADSRRVGLVDIGTKHKKWLFSMSLFAPDELPARVKRIIRGAVLVTYSRSLGTWSASERWRRRRRTS